MRAHMIHWENEVFIEHALEILQMHRIRLLC